jgi:hypothetical protein
MLDHEYQLLIERLAASRGANTTFFVFADTVAARNYKGTNEAHGWMGVRFQLEPGGEPSEIVLHVRMWDKENVLQQEALGIVGTNLLYGAFYYRNDPAKFTQSLLDNLSADRIEVDMLRFSGPAFKHVDNRLMSLHLVQFGLTNAVMFGTQGEVLQPSEVLYKKAILVERGSFRPVTHVNVDMLTCATAQFVQEPLVKDKDVIVLMEITMNNLLAEGSLNAQDFLARVDLLADIGFTVLRDNVVSIFRFGFCYFPTQYDGVLNLTQVGATITAPGIIALKGRTVMRTCDMLGLIHRPVWVVVRMPVGHLLYRSVPIYAELGNRQRVEPPDFW